MEDKVNLVPSLGLRADPIFIIGVMRRCGTNFVSHLLRLHPDCGAPPLVWEDFLLATSHLLDEYVDTASGHWTGSLGKVPEGLDSALCRHLGNSLVSFLIEQVDAKRVVTKTPDVRNLESFFKWFPDARLLIVIRDGRAVVESFVRSFGTSYEATMRDWAVAADTIFRFDQANKSSGFKYLIVRYEDIYTDSEQELRRILDFLDLSAEVYDFEAAANLPIRGSSVFHGEKKTIHWKPIEKTTDFKPLQRWSHWERTMHERFNWIAGQYLVQFGYEQKQYYTNRLLWKVLNQAMDKWWQVKGLF